MANTSTSTLTRTTNGQKKQSEQPEGNGEKPNYSSDDSLDDDDDDARSKSLFEQCILSGMHKSNDTLESEGGEPAEQRQEPSARDRFVSNQVRQIESMLAGRQH